MTFLYFFLATILFGLTILRIPYAILWLTFFYNKINSSKRQEKIVMGLFDIASYGLVLWLVYLGLK